MEQPIHVDVCIVGSGPAGAIVTSQLAGRGKRIAIVEGGSWNDVNEQSRRLDGGSAAQLAISKEHLHVPMRVYSGVSWMYWQIKKVGGNSRIWGGMCPRGLESQFKMKSVYGVGEDWPIDYAELEPFYCQAEEELGVSGPSQADQKPWRSKPYPLPAFDNDYVGQLFANACTSLGYSSETTPTAKATQAYRGREACRYCNVNKCMSCLTTARYKSDVHIRQAMLDPNVSLLTDTTAATFVLGDTGRIEQLLCYMPDRSRRTVVADLFVLAGNTVGNARLLLLSAQGGHPDGLANRSQAVGRYYMGHPVYEYLAQMKTRVSAARSAFTAISRHFEAGEHIRDAAGFRMFINGSDQSAPLHGMRLVDQGLYGTRFKSALKELTRNGIKASVVTDCLPRPENRIEIDPENLDYFGQPGLKVTYNYGEYEESGRRLGAQTMARVLDALEATPTGEAAYDVAHQLGTTRMGTDPESSVVNRDLRAHDVDNLYIAGGSVFPNALGPTNPTLTIAALSMRLGQHLRQRLGL
ncbi:MAG: family oxidoreductase [Myxococcales bacterium]|nr:family oxidoreductase [Myxococcales bacterium]